MMYQWFWTINSVFKKRLIKSYNLPPSIPYFVPLTKNGLRTYTLIEWARARKGGNYLPCPHRNTV